MSTSTGFFATQAKRTKTMLETTRTVIGGFRQAHRIGALKAEEPPRDVLPKYIQVFCRKMLRSFDIEVIEVDTVDRSYEKSHGLWVSNHISWMDIPVVGSVAPVFFLSKSEIAKWPVIGTLAKAAGTLFIHRGSGDTSSVSDQIATFLKNGSSVVFFPEATTTNGHKMKRIHGKLLKAAMDTGLPILPIVTCYVSEDGTISDDIAYYGNISMKESLKKVLDSKKITAYVLPLEPLMPEEKTQKELTAILQERMQTGLTRLQKKVLKVKPEGAEW